MSRLSLAVVCLVSLCLVGLFAPPARAADAPALELKKGDKIVIIGNTLAERMQYFGHFETLLHSRFPQLELVVRNLGWSADELTLRPRSQGFADHGHRLEDEKPDVIVAAFGFNESFAGADGLPKFQSDLENFIRETTTTKYNGTTPPQLVLLSPIACEDLKSRTMSDGRQNNERIAQYTRALAAAAEKNHVVFIDLFGPSGRLMAAASQPLTINGIHLSSHGDAEIGRVLDTALFGPRPADKIDLEKLRAEVNEKNLQFFYDYRAVNGCYIYGGRKTPFGVVNFPAEFAKLRKMTAGRDQRIWAVAAGKSVPATIDDSGTGDFAKIESNVAEQLKITSPEESLATFKLPAGYECNLFASEVQFPDLKNPVAMTFDARGRLWVCTMPTYPMYLPGTPVHDKLLIFEDTNGDGQADKQTVFADNLYLPTGLELGDGGVYVGAAQRAVSQGHRRRRPRRHQGGRPLRLRFGRFAPRRPRLHLGSGRSAALQRGHFPLFASRNPLRTAADSRRRPVPLPAPHRQVRSLCRLRLRQSLGALRRPLGTELRGRRLGRSQLLRHRLQRTDRLSQQAWPLERIPDQAVAADLRLRAGLQPQLSRRRTGELPAQQLHRLSGGVAI